MNTSSVRYKRHRFPPQIIAHTVWLYFRFPLSLRLVEELLLECVFRGDPATDSDSIRPPIPI